MRDIKYALWGLNGYLGVRMRIASKQKLTVLITYYNPARMKHINHQLRNLLKCVFVEQIIISNHNPDVDIKQMVEVKDDRITIINHETRRGCGYRWLVAEQFSPEYLVVVDDDILLFPWQLKKLFAALIQEPEIPHGFAGMIHHENGFLEYREQLERPVDYICEIYAVTGEHLNKYSQLKQEVLKNPDLTHTVEFAADFVILSQTGAANPKIHDGGRLFRCTTYNETGVAVHKDAEFDVGILEVASTLKKEKALAG